MTHDESSVQRRLTPCPKLRISHPNIDLFLYSCRCPPNSGLYVKINLFQIVTDVGYKTNYKTIS